MSPDGESAAFWFHEYSVCSHLYLIDMSTGTKRLLANSDGGGGGAVAFSPDGTQIAYKYSLHDYSYNLYYGSVLPD